MVTFTPGLGLVALAVGAAPGPLHVSADNPRYFADPSGRCVYLVGAHTWSNLKDMGPTDPPTAFDYERHLDFLAEHHHNFIRLWHWELTRYGYGGKTTYATPFPWPLTGPGEALDGKPRFDLAQLDPAYFERLRQRVAMAGERGIYVSVMLFEGHGLHASDAPWCWDGHPFNARNNVNGIDGDPNHDGRGTEIQTLAIPAVTALQEVYVRKVLDTLDDLDNVLYEIVNESGAYSTEWQYYLIRLIHEHERGLPKQHPVGMTFQYHRATPGTNQGLFDSPAEWISPNPQGGWRDDPPPADGRKVILNDTDHLWGLGGNVDWVWKSFLRGCNPLFMDPYHIAGDLATGARTWTDHLGRPRDTDPRWDPVRDALGQTLRVAERMDLRRAVPHGELASTGWCLADPGREYAVYLPAGGEVTVDLTAAAGALDVTWFHATGGDGVAGGTVEGGARRALKAPFDGAAAALLLVH
ncbi:MAG: hypothetical protein HYU66_27670 [Armatimonadetes bacterium]|nr:hypothetical protein [Armatimonadota bacterium]